MHDQVAGEEASGTLRGVRYLRSCRKCGFERVIIGLSGGIDLALTAAIAADAGGSKNVIGVGLAWFYLSQISDARQLAENLRGPFRIAVHYGLRLSKDPAWCFRRAERRCYAEENLQSRARLGMLMALSNKFGALDI